MHDAEWKVTNLINNAASGYPGGLRAIHGGMPGRAYSTLSGDVNPNNHTAHLKVADMIHIMKATGDIDALRYMAALFGMRLHPMDGNEPDAPTMYEEFYQTIKASVNFQKLGVAFRAKQASHQELLAARDAVHSEVDQDFIRIVKGDEGEAQP